MQGAGLHAAAVLASSLALRALKGLMGLASQKLCRLSSSLSHEYDQNTAGLIAQLLYLFCHGKLIVRRSIAPYRKPTPDLRPLEDRSKLT